MPIAFLLLLLPRPHHRRQLQRESKVVFSPSLSLSLSSIIAQGVKKKNVGTLEIAKGSKRSFLLCK